MIEILLVLGLAAFISAEANADASGAAVAQRRMRGLPVPIASMRKPLFVLKRTDPGRCALMRSPRNTLGACCVSAGFPVD
jgi:hypothetical protein